jgi:hypothetical protein
VSGNTVISRVAVSIGRTRARAMNPESFVNLSDAYTRRLIADAEDRAELDNASCVVAVQREGEALSKRRRFKEELARRVVPMELWRGRW